MIGIIIAAVILAFILLLIFLPVVALSILAFVALVLLVVLFIPVGVEMSYIDNKLSLAAKLSFYSYKLLPKKEKAEAPGEAEKKADPEKKKKEKTQNKDKKKQDKEKKKLKLNFEEIIEIVKKALKGLSKFGKLTVHNFMLHYVAAGNDPYSTAMTYNYVNAGLSALAPCCAHAFKLKGDVDVWTDIDFSREKMFIETQFSVTLRLVQLLHVAIVAGFGVLCVLIKNKRRLSKEKKLLKKAESQATPSVEKENNKEINIQQEERKDSNG